MFHNWQLVIIALAYIGLLFVIAYLGDKYRHKIFGKSQAIVYALTLGVYCTSWSFLGTTGQTATNIFSHIPIYLGPILLFMFAWPFIKRIIRVSLKLNLTSIADLLSSRFGKSHNLAILVTMVALIGTLPYMALQLKAIVYSFELLQIKQEVSNWQLGLITSITMAGFTIFFGIRNIDVTERHPGVMLAIAFESLIKIIAFVAIAIFVCFFLFDSPSDLWKQANVDINQQFNWPNISSMLGMLVIVMAAFLSLPRQFQVMIVELKDKKDTRFARRIFPFYLLIFAVLAIPLGLAGHLLFNGSIAADAYVLMLPVKNQQVWLASLTFLGAISAASSMIIISAIALSTMLSNEIVFPLLFRRNNQQGNDYERFRLKLLNIRKLLVLIIILMGYGAFLLASDDTLASLGAIAFGCIAQLTPALIAAFYWRHASLTGVYSGIATGFSLWFLLNLLPNLGFYDQSIFLGELSNNTTATLISFASNIFVMWSISLLSRQNVHERVQAAFFNEDIEDFELPTLKKKQITGSELQLLISRFIGEEKASVSFASFEQKHASLQLDEKQLHQSLINHCENTLGTVMGSASARLVINSAMQGRNINLNELAQLVEETSTQQQQDNQHLLQSAIENASEGFSIIDSQLNLVAWNKRYLELFNYPEDMVYAGCKIERLIRYNAEQGLCGQGEIEQQVSRRLHYLRNGSSHTSERQLATGQIIRIEGSPLPDGGFVMIFKNITAFRETEMVLKAENLDLESIVTERTQKLELVNQQLAVAREKSEQAHLKKSQYLKAISHDLMQPLEAARLFTSALADQNKLNDSQKRQVQNIDHSLKVANDLLINLAEVARIESGNISPNIEVFCLADLLKQLEQEFSASADEYQIELKVFDSEYWVKSDKHLLRRILQNLLTNAFRYASPGRVVLAVQLESEQLKIQVVDDGPGIAEDKQQLVFEQFTQLDNGKNHASNGLGLGLNITRSLSQILGHTLHLVSEPDCGCNFSISVPKAEPISQAEQAPTQQIGLQGVSVLCIDNDPKVLEGMLALLTAWQCKVYGASGTKEAKEVFSRHNDEIEILLVDYQLDNNDNGIDLIKELRVLGQRQIPAILITATTDPDIENKTSKANVGYMRKMVKPAALRAMMSAMLTSILKANYMPKQ
ncbi:PAS domain-containing hybrid sensor histidine kinase/response regulator [Thalassotalea fonticola]|uniref:histidine kinase n=1 Tax=Thalassotalea fonticola TaxID=3065649 RepID=A0ABZ0GLB7_9GAMM|nr:PAS domain-containing hybrid sensor histidine kinase/response regulator [Colwelliaceae bacterium S1-1]